MVTNQNRLSAYFGFLFYFHNSGRMPFVITHRISKCLKRIILKLLKLYYVRTGKEYVAK